MKALGYVFLVFLVIGCWIIWQVIRRASAGAQAIINPERYAIQKVEQMQQDMLVGRLLLERESDPTDNKSYPTDKWGALVKYDAEISEAAEQLRPYGEAWINKLGHAYFALEEDRSYLPNIVRRLLDEAKDEEERKRVKVELEANQRWARAFPQTPNGEPCTEVSRNILRQAETLGYVVSIDGRAIAVTKAGRGTSYLYSNEDIQRFGRYL
jgi:hypothetical protein